MSCPPPPPTHTHTELSIQDKTKLCQILWITSASTISLYNSLKAVVTQYNVNNRDAWLYFVWLPSLALLNVTASCSSYNCPAMLPDDSSFIYLMDNKCAFVDTTNTTNVALRNANSDQVFVKIWKDCIQENVHDSKPQKKISEVLKYKGKVP
ncbi:LOW QUALITY PROTEIN: posterior protein-like [Leptodactylus fuscus]